MDASNITTAAIVIGVIVAYVLLIFAPAIGTPKNSPHRQTVQLLCVVSLFIPIVWIVALVFACIRTPSPPTTRQLPDPATRH